MSSWVSPQAPLLNALVLMQFELCSHWLPDGADPHWRTQKLTAIASVWQAQQPVAVAHCVTAVAGATLLYGH